MTDELKQRAEQMRDEARDKRYLKACEMARKRREIDEQAERLKEKCS